jgi:hypothetical protein
VSRHHSRWLAWFVVGALAFAVLGGGKIGHGLTELTDSVGKGTTWTGSVTAGRAEFARELIHGVGARASGAHLAAVEVWELAEGGGFGNQASNNPLNINPGSASWPGYPADGAWAFPTWGDGLSETIAYLKMPNYAGILRALRSRTDEHAVLVEIVASPWAGSHYSGNQVMQQALNAT